MKTINLFADFNILEDYWFLGSLAAIVFLIVAVIVLFIRDSKLSDKVQRHRMEYKQGIQISINKIAELSNGLQKLDSNLNAKPKEKNAVDAVPVAAPIPVAETERPYEVELSVPEKPKVIEFYMSTPNPDGTFEANQSSDVFRKTISLFKFTANPKNPSTATFEFFSDDSGMKDALSNPKTYLTPVCYEENDAFTGAKKIVVQKPGTAVKNGDKWVVDKNEKLRIKYQ